jgi:HEAT repeats/Tetratricopeptide repeat
MRNWGVLGIVAISLIAGGEAVAAAPLPAESSRMARAKDLISDDQWAAAIPVLRAASTDPKEQNKDEALFWLAHSQNQAGDLAEAVDSIRRLQREFPRSRWAQPAGSLMIELAQKLGRRDVLWKAAVPPEPPAPPQAIPAPAPPSGPRTPRARKGPAALPPPPPAPPATTPPAQPAPPAPPMPWFPESYAPGEDVRIQALGRLIKTDAQKVIPILRNIALEPDNPGAARRAVFVLAQSRNPDAQSTVVDVAKTGPEPVRVAAIRVLGQFGGPEVSTALLEVYSTGKMPVKRQVVVSLGERADTSSLFRIAQSENDDRLRDAAIVTLGKVGGREQLRLLFARASKETRLAVIRGLFLARDDDGLIRIAGQEKDPELRSEVLNRLRLIGTPQAKEYLDSVK